MLLVIIKWKKHWFFTEAGQENPYKAVLRIISFAKNINTHFNAVHSPMLTTTYHPDSISPRKGMADPSQQNKLKTVKTLLRTLLTLLAIGPVFMLEVPASMNHILCFNYSAFTHFIITSMWEKNFVALVKTYGK